MKPPAFDISRSIRRQTPTQYILALARSFPSLEPKLRFWNPAVFDADDFYVSSRPWSNGERSLAHFVLTVWNPGYARQKGWTFDLVDVADSLGAEDRAALFQWVMRPVYP